MTEGVGEALIVHELALTKEFDRLANIGIVDHAKDVVVRDARLLLRRQILVEIGDDVALDSDIFHIGGDACGARGVDACGVVDEILREGRAFDLGDGQIFGQLGEDRAHHLEMRELLGSHVGEDADYLTVGHREALIEVAHRRGELAVGSAELTYDDRGSAGVGIFDLDRELKFLFIYPHNAFSYECYCQVSQGQGVLAQSQEVVLSLPYIVSGPCFA